jgi:hypothetical protein
MHGHSAGSAHNNSQIPWPIWQYISYEVENGKEERNFFFLARFHRKRLRKREKYSGFMLGSSAGDVQHYRVFY